MSVNLERYVELYAKLGDNDIEDLLQKAAKLSRRRVRPDTVCIDKPLDFTHNEAEIIQEIERHQQLQKMLVGFFKREAPVGTDRKLGQLVEPYY